MLKVNLLPPHIYERRRTRQTAFIFGMVFMLLVGFMLAWWWRLGECESRLGEEVGQLEREADEVRAIEQLAVAEEGKIPPIKAKLDFIEGIMAYNLKVPDLYEELARYTYSRVLYRSVQPSGDQITIQAYTRSVGDCGRYLLNLYRANHLFKLATISAVPGYPQGETGGGAAPGAGVQVEAPRGFDFTVTLGLVNPLAAPSYGRAAGAGQPGMPAGPGMGPGPRTELHD